jgi:hypothetical protein
MSKIVCTVAELVNAIPKSRVWENHKHGSVGAGIAIKHFINHLKE